MSLYLAIQSLGAVRRAAARQDWSAADEAITNAAILLAAEATEAVKRTMEAVHAAYAAAPAGLKTTDLRGILTVNLGAAVADRVLDGIGEGLGGLTLGELETRLLGIML